jgi:hypothetical protein
VGREPDVVRRRHHHVRHDPSLQAGHPVCEHDLGDAAEDLKVLGQQRQRGGLLLVLGEPDEPCP